MNKNKKSGCFYAQNSYLARNGESMAQLSLSSPEFPVYLCKWTGLNSSCKQQK